MPKKVADNYTRMLQDDSVSTIEAKSQIKIAEEIRRPKYI